MTSKGDQQANGLPKLSAPALRALLGAGCTRLDQVARLNEAEIKQLHGIGPNALDQLRRALAANGMSFANGKSSRPSV